MRRALAAILSLALVGGVLLSPGAGSVAAAGESGAECLWQRHSKRVVKHVRRHGKKRRVVRTRHWWTCEAAPATDPAPTPTPPVPPTGPEPVANRISVKSEDNPAFKYTLSHPQALSGTITIELNNKGEDPHNLNLQLEGSAEPVYEFAETAPDEQSVATFNLPAGAYQLWCSIPTHDEQGMHATLVLE